MAFGSGFSIGSGFAAKGSSFQGLGNVNKDAVDRYGRSSGDLGFTRFYAEGTRPQPISIRRSSNFVDSSNRSATLFPNGIAPSSTPFGGERPSVDLFNKYGGWGGLIGLQNPLNPGTYTLSQLLGLPEKKPAPVVPQYSPDVANRMITGQLTDLINQKNPSLLDAIRGKRV